MKNKILIAAGITVLLTACDVKDPIYDTEHPENGKVTLTVDWTDRGEGIAIPANYHVRANNDESTRATFTEATNAFPYLFEEGNHRLHVYHDATDIALNGNTVSVRATQPGMIAAKPGWFFSSAIDAMSTKDKVNALTAPMRQQVRQLTLIIEITGGTAEEIESITGTLSGVAGTLDIDNGTHGSPSSVAMDFMKITEGTHAGKWSATVWLLGVAGNEQRLTSTITFADNNPEAMPFDSNLTTLLSTFNTDKKTPLTLNGMVAESPTGAGFTATITDWTPVMGGSGIAN